MTIVVGYVPKPEGRAALEAAIEEAKLRQEPVFVLNVARGDSYADAALATSDDLERVRQLLEESTVQFELEQHVRGRDGAEELLDAASSRQASLLVIGLRRRSPTGKLVFGSHAQRILLEASCPVLAVKAPNAA